MQASEILDHDVAEHHGRFLMHLNFFRIYENVISYLLYFSYPHHTYLQHQLKNVWMSTKCHSCLILYKFYTLMLYLVH
jgi:hypothetical protein